MDAPGRMAAWGAALLLSACGTAGGDLADAGPPALRGAPAGPLLQPQTASPQSAPVDPWFEAFRPWTPQTPDYLLFPGDQIEIIVPSAPELSRTVTIGPDGRFNFPYVGAVMAANRSTPEVTQSLQSALARDLRRPYVEISPIAFGSQKILVLGEVAQPGMYDLPGPMGALEAVALAGGFGEGADKRNVSVIRRATDGQPMRREVNLAATLRGIDGGDYDVLARYDIVFVPRSGLASAGLFMQQISNLVPFNIGFSYALNDDDDDINGFASTQ